MTGTPLAAPRIGFNALLLSPTTSYRAAGIHRYIAALLDALASVEGAEVMAFTGNEAASAVVPRAVQTTAAPSWARGRAGRILWEQLALPRALRKAQCDVLHSAAYAMPLACPVPAVVTVHDLSFLRLPETFPRAQRTYLRTATRRAVRHAAALVAVSQFTKDELIRLLDAAPERIHVVPNGLDPACRPLPRQAVERFRAARGLPERFILSVGTLQPRKNLRTLLTAYAELRRSWPASEADAPPELVVAGAAGWGDEDPQALAERLGIAAHTHWTGFVPQAELPLLYNAAQIFALPSRYEGFGLPALEAMGCGTPVVVSDAASLPEVVGDAGLLVPPLAADAWASALGRLAMDEPRRRSLAAAGLQRAGRFSWARAARSMTRLWRDVAPPLRPRSSVASSAAQPEGRRGSA